MSRLTMSDDERIQLERTRAFISYFTAKEVGGYLHPALEPRIDPNTGLSIYATEEIRQEEKVVSCPFGLVITPQLAREAIESLSEGSDLEGVGEWKETMLVCGYICLHWIYHDLGRIPDSLKHWEYISSLPPSSTLRTPLHFTDAEMGLLEGTNLYGATSDRRKQWEAEWTSVKSVLGDGITWERYLTAATYISSRAFPSKLLKLDAGNGGSTSAVQTSEEEESHPVLIPGMDMFNHARGQPVTWSTTSTPSPSISIISPGGYEPNTQVFNNYGPKPNEELFLGYGFVLSPNPDEVVALRLGGMASQISEGKRKTLEKKGLDAEKRWVIKRNGEIPRDLMEVLRVLMGDDKPHNHDHAHDHDHGDDDEDDDEDEHEHGVWEEEMELELDVLGSLGQMLEDKLLRLESVDTKSTKIEARSDVREMCAVYRRGQVEILEKAMETVEERIERVERLTAEGQGCPCCN